MGYDKRCRLAFDGKRDNQQGNRGVCQCGVHIWEVSIKAALGKLKIDQDRFMKALPATGFEPLPVTWEHADTVRRLPAIHRDPFNRILVAQAVSEPLNLMTADKVLIQYSELVLFV